MLKSIDSHKCRSTAATKMKITKTLFGDSNK